MRMADERIFTIPLRKEWNKAPKYKRAKKAVNATKKFIARHMKVAEVKVGSALNRQLWSRGGKHPPSRIKVKSIVEEGNAWVELVDVPFELKKAEEKKSLKEKLFEKKEEKKEQEKVETAEVRKELEKERDIEAKKEHVGHERIPEKELKEEEKTKLKTEKIVKEHGKKGASSPKP